MGLHVGQTGSLIIERQETHSLLREAKSIIAHCDVFGGSKN